MSLMPKLSGSDVGVAISLQMPRLLSVELSNKSFSRLSTAQLIYNTLTQCSYMELNKSVKDGHRTTQGDNAWPRDP